MKKIVVFSGAGISAESGLNTFRDKGGLWEEYDIMEVATPEAWEQNPKLVLDFYNKRRKQILEAKPNNAHKAIVELEKKYDVQVITQNIDDLHERAGSKNVLHLHGVITKSRSSIDENLLYDIKGHELSWGELCEKGSQLRPHVVWFGEDVPEMKNAERIIKTADILIVVGTSLNVYPAASLIHFVKKTCKIYLVDPKKIRVPGLDFFTQINEKASIGIPILANQLLLD